jgi:Peptidase family M28
VTKVVGEAPALLRALATAGRFTGTPALDRARALCASWLTDTGFNVRESAFRYSTVPARFGMPVLGLSSAALLGLTAGLEAWHAFAAAAFAAGTGLVLLTALARWLTSPAALALPWAGAGGVNLEATRGGAPRVWLVAHLDSKSQRYPLAWRAAGATVSLSAWAGALVSVAARLGPASWWHAWFVWAPGLVGAALLMFASVGNESPGAVDNASGVASVLGAVKLLPRDTPVGVLLTDAEETGLAGAHAWAATRPPGVAVNCDTVDDRGSLMLLTSGRRPAAVVAAVQRATRRTGQGCRVRALPMGVLTDGVALSRAGWVCGTVGRATIGTLLRIHTSRDSVELLTGSGVALASALLAATVQELS